MPDDDSETKLCPACGQTILAAAIKCRYCRSDLAEAQKAIALQDKETAKKVALMKLIKRAESALEAAEQEHGADSVEVVERLETYAGILKDAGVRLQDAAEMEARAKEIMSNATKKCPFCSEEIKATAIRCKHCASDLQRVGIARESHANDLKSATATGNFGLAVSLLPPAQQAAYQAEFERRRRNAGIAYVLCILLGWLGLHKFYMGQSGWGLTYLLCAFGGLFTFGFTLLLPIFGCLADLLIIPSLIGEENDRVRKQILDEISARL